MPTDCASTLDPMYKSFQIDDVLYTRYKLARVISLNPYFTTDTSSEKSCLSTLLMHMPWNVAGEESLLIIRDQTFTSAVEAVQHAIDNNLFPLYVKDTMLGICGNQRPFCRIQARLASIMSTRIMSQLPMTISMSKPTYY